MVEEQVELKKIKEFIVKGLEEDVKQGDHTSLACIPSDNIDRAKLLIKEDCVIAGIELAKHIFKHVDPNAKIDVLMDDGTEVKYGDIVFTVSCNSQALLQTERLVLNSMQRMSGIATLSRQFKNEVADLPVTILDTRKTTPLIRFLEKWAVRIGGSSNYRDGLYDWIMIKDNHIDACGSIPKAIQKVRDYFEANNMKLGMTVEVRNLNELKQTMEHGKGVVTRIMLDNFDLDVMKQAVEIVGDDYEVEASGGITMETVRNVALTGVDFISSGAITHSSKSKDMSLKIIK